MLIQHGSVVNKKDIKGNNAIYYSIHYKNSDCLKMLLLNFAIIDNNLINLSKEDNKMKNIV